jgi:hypothetical protein
MKGERTPRDLHEAFPEDYDPVLHKQRDRTIFTIAGLLVAAVVAVIAAAIYFWS